jgi:predicted dienelactone hydrolase
MAMIAPLLGVALVIVAGMASAADFSAGIANATLVDPVEGGPMAAIVVYPTTAPAGSTDLGPFHIAATRDARPAPGRFPLVVLSHGTGGSALGHHDSLTALARAGFVAAAVDHPRDNYRDDSGFGTDLQTLGRPHHIVALIDFVLTNSRFAAMVDPQRIGMAGFSAGGYTTLVIAGARPNLALRAEYRRAVPEDPLMRRVDAASTQPHRPGLEIVADPRVRAAFVMAPALGFVFDRAGLADVHVPIRLYRAGADEVLPHPWHAERVRQMLPTPPEYVVIENTGHYVFLAPCSEALAAAVPEICNDPRASTALRFTASSTPSWSTSSAARSGRTEGHVRRRAGSGRAGDKMPPLAAPRKAR